MSGQNNDAEPPPQVPGHILRSLRRQQRRQPGLRRAGPRHPRLLRPRHRGQQGEDGLPPTVTMCYPTVRISQCGVWWVIVMIMMTEERFPTWEVSVHASGPTEVFPRTGDSWTVEL